MRAGNGRYYPSARTKRASATSLKPSRVGLFCSGRVRSPRAVECPLQVCTASWLTVREGGCCCAENPRRKASGNSATPKGWEAKSDIADSISPRSCFFAAVHSFGMIETFAPAIGCIHPGFKPKSAGQRATYASGPLRCSNATAPSMKKMCALFWPFQETDCHMANHSPPTVRNPTP